MEKIREKVLERIVKIGVLLYQTRGFPLELYNEKIEEMSFLEQIGFINSFASRNKSIQPIFYE